ncbi:MAG: 2'-5' RNA ligase family protein [Candidatus Methylomirabilia bacterium]
MDGVRLIIITVPPAGVRNELSVLRANCAGVSSSHAATAYPPHVTLRTGLTVPEAAMGSCHAGLGALLEGIRPFEIRTGDIVFRTITRDRREVPVVALAIEPSAALLSLNARLLTYAPYRASDRTCFWPHLTLAFQDLSPEGSRRLEKYLAAREDLRSRQFAWSCDNVALYRHHGRRWRRHHVYKLA